MYDELIKLGEGTPDIPGGYLEYVQKITTATATMQRMCGLNGVSKTMFIIHPVGCNRDRRLEVTIQ